MADSHLYFNGVYFGVIGALTTGFKAQINRELLLSQHQARLLGRTGIGYGLALVFVSYGGVEDVSPGTTEPKWRSALHFDEAKQRIVLGGAAMIHAVAGLSMIGSAVNPALRLNGRVMYISVGTQVVGQAFGAARFLGYL